MKKRQYRFDERTDTAIVRLAVDIAATLNLKNWTIGLSPELPETTNDPDQPAAMAQVDAVPHRHYAVIRVCDDFLNLGHDDILLVLLHEVCHLYFVSLRTQCTQQMELGSMSVSEYNQYHSAYHHHEEMAVDLMSVAWWDLMRGWDKVQKRLNKITKQNERTAP